MLIINRSIPKMIKGYPTVSDKYNVSGAVLAGDTSVKFGDLVKFSATKGYFEAIAPGSLADVTTLGGFVLATNVKLNLAWAGDDVSVLPGEAFNLLVNGFIAVELAAGAVATDVTANKAVYVTADGVPTTVSDDSKLDDALPNVVFTGEYEMVGDVIRAEIYVK